MKSIKKEEKEEKIQDKIGVFMTAIESRREKGKTMERVKEKEEKVERLNTE